MCAVERLVLNTLMILCVKWSLERGPFTAVPLQHFPPAALRVYFGRGPPGQSRAPLARGARLVGEEEEEEVQLRV